MDFEFYTASKIVFGNGKVDTVGKLASPLAKHWLIVTQQPQIDGGVVSRVVSALEKEGISAELFTEVNGEPTVTTVDRAAAAAKQRGNVGLIGLGGGSCIDTAKAAAGLAANEGSVRDYLEGVGTGRIMVNAPLPFIAIPTTSGTGAEATKNAVVMSYEEHFKKSFRDERLLARVALVDPELTVSVPKAVTASTGMDAITQLIESYISRKAKPMTDALAIYALRRSPEMLMRAYDNGADLEAREHMSRCSLFSGITLANSGLGAAHGIAAALGASFGVPHGTACAMFLRHVMRYNLAAGGEKLGDVGRALADRYIADNAEAAEEGARIIERLNDYLSIPSKLSEVGVARSDLRALAHDSLGSSMSGNPVPMDEDAIYELLCKIYE